MIESEESRSRRVEESALPVGGESGPRRSASWVEVDLSAVRHNVSAVRRFLGGSGLIAVVKANAYGHGAVEVARAAQQGGATGLAVACAAEGEQLRRAGLEGPILVLAAGDPAAAPELVALGLSQTVCTEDMATALASAGERQGSRARLHLKIDTGMGRLGRRSEEAGAFGAAVQRLPGVVVEGAFTHFATAEEADTSYLRLQFSRFEEALQDLAAAGLRPPVRHAANSAAALRFPEMKLDAVRTGLLVYGLRPDAPGLPDIALRPALAWKTRVAFARRLPEGCPVSYGRTYITPGERLVGVLPVGYADGYPRHASNRAQVLVRGTLCPVIGTVCMDHVMVDLTPAGEVAIGEEVVLIGAQQGRRITANQVAEWAGTVVHQVPTVIGNRVARYYIGEAGDRESGIGDRRERPVVDAAEVEGREA
jgi:alanine racemase